MFFLSPSLSHQLLSVQTLSAQRIQDVQSPVIPIVGQLTAETPGTISLGQGVVHYDPPRQVFESVAKSTLHDRSLDRYGPVVGDGALLDLIRDKLARENGILLAQGSSVVCTAGANMAFINAVLAIADIGDEIILLAPYYFNHHMAIEIAGCRVVTVNTDGNNQPDVDAIRSAMTSRTRAVVTVSPNNPTGAVYAKDTLAAINQLCSQKGVFHISDEAYEYFTHDGVQHFSPGSLPDASDHTISIFSLSKAYAMAGWRVGYCVIPNRLMESIKKIQDTNLICPPKICQAAAAAALEVGADWCRQQIAQYTRVRDASLQTLAILGDRCRIAVPQGAFYLFLDLQSDCDDMQLVETLIREYRVAALPGNAFGSAARCSLRISYGALDGMTAAEGVGRLAAGLDKLL